MSNVTIMNHPLIKHKISMLRNENTGTNEFRTLVEEIAMLMGYEALRGSDSYCFTFSDDWLKKHGDLFLSDDLNNYPGQQYTQPGKDIFGCFSDALPDRWGRTLLLRREQLAAIEENRPVRR